MSSRQGATGGCCTFQPLLHAEGSQGWSSSRRREIFLRGGELSTKGNPEQVNGSRTRSAPSATAGCPKHPSQHPSCEVGFQLRSSSLCKKKPLGVPPGQPVGQGGAGEGHGCTEARGNPKEAKPRPLGSNPGVEKSSEKSSLASPRDNLGLASLGASATINPALRSLAWLFTRKRMAQVTGTNASPLGYWFERSPAGRDAGAR